MSVFIWQYNHAKNCCGFRYFLCVVSKHRLPKTDILHPLAELYRMVCCLSLNYNHSAIPPKQCNTKQRYLVQSQRMRQVKIYSTLEPNPLILLDRIPLFFRFSLFLPSLECTCVPLLMPGDWLSNHVNPKPGFPPQACRHASSLIKRAYSAIYVSPCLHPLNPEDALGRKLKQTATNKAHKYHTPINSRPKDVLTKRCKTWHTDKEKLLSMKSILIWMRKNTHTDFV